MRPIERTALRPASASSFTSRIGLVAPDPWSRASPRSTPTWPRARSSYSPCTERSRARARARLPAGQGALGLQPHAAQAEGRPRSRAPRGSRQLARPHRRSCAAHFRRATGSRQHRRSRAGGEHRAGSATGRRHGRQPRPRVGARAQGVPNPVWHGRRDTAGPAPSQSSRWCTSATTSPRIRI